MPFSKEELQGAQFNKMGFFAKLLIRPQEDETVYWAKNCSVKCFDGDFVLFPNSSTQDSMTMYGTTAYLFSVKINSRD